MYCNIEVRCIGISNFHVSEYRTLMYWNIKLGCVGIPNSMYRDIELDVSEYRTSNISEYRNSNISYTLYLFPDITFQQKKEALDIVSECRPSIYIQTTHHTTMQCKTIRKGRGGYRLFRYNSGVSKFDMSYLVHTRHDIPAAFYRKYKK